MKENLAYDRNLVTQLLAERRLHIVDGTNHKTAFVDTKTGMVYIPAWFDNFENKSVGLIMRMHELGHVVYTPLRDYSHEAMKSEFGRKFAKILNIFEDARIEARIKEKFPGAAKEFNDGYESVFTDENSPVRLVVNNISRYSKADRINVVAKYPPSDLLLVLTDEERSYMTAAQAAESFIEIVALTNKFCAAEYGQNIPKEEMREKLEKMITDSSMDEFDTSFGDSDPENESEEGGSSTDQNIEESEETPGEASSDGLSSKDSEESDSENQTDSEKNNSGEESSNKDSAEETSEGKGQEASSDNNEEESEDPFEKFVKEEEKKAMSQGNHSTNTRAIRVSLNPKKTVAVSYKDFISDYETAVTQIGNNNIPYSQRATFRNRFAANYASQVIPTLEAELADRLSADA